MSEAERIAWLRLGVEALANQLARGDQHQAIDQHGFALAGGREVAADQGALAGIVQVVGDVGRVTGGNGNQRVERGAPGVERVRDQFDLFDRALRLVGHGLSLRRR